MAANHGFIPHNGILNMVQATEGLASSFSMGGDISAALSVFSVVMGGNIVDQTWSIGGPFPGIVPGVKLNQHPQGISYSHNNYEGDSSGTRYDAYMNKGDAHSLDMDKFTKLYESGTTYTMESVQSQYSSNQEESISQNPYYFNGPFSGLIVVPAATNFIINFMSNHSAEQPNGFLDRNVLKSMMGITGEPGSFVWAPGQERIPMNWYRRPSAVPYTIPTAVADVIAGYVKTPSTLRLGGNMGTVNSFAGVDFGDLTGGVYNEKTLFQGDNFACFVFQATSAGLPAVLQNTLTDIEPAMALVNKYFFGPALAGLTCPQLTQYDGALYNQYPGYSYHPTGPDQSF